jgi:glutaminase
LMSIASIYEGLRADRKFENYTNVLSKMIAGRRVGFNNEACLAELVSCHKNYCLTYILQEKGLIPEDADISAIIEFYTMVCNIELTLEDIAVLAGTLANGGIQPETGLRCFNNPDSVKNTLSHMISCGMNTYSGEWAFNISLPAKTGYSGATIMIVPNVCGVAVYHPVLDKHRNSEKGKSFLNRFVYEFNYNNIDVVYGKGLLIKQIEQEKTPEMNIIYHAGNGDLRQLKRLVAKGHSVNFKDYDNRTPLHLAVENGHLTVVKYLLSHGASPKVVDISGFDALKSAEKGGCAEIISLVKTHYH